MASAYWIICNFIELYSILSIDGPLYLHSFRSLDDIIYCYSTTIIQGNNRIINIDFQLLFFLDAFLYIMYLNLWLPVVVNRFTFLPLPIEYCIDPVLLFIHLSVCPNWKLWFIDISLLLCYGMMSYLVWSLIMMSCIV